MQFVYNFIFFSLGKKKLTCKQNRLGVVGRGSGLQKLELSWDPVHSIPTIPTPWGCSKVKPVSAI